VSVSPILQALYEGRREDAHRLRREQGSADLLDAAALGEVDGLAEGDVAQRSADGFTPLHYAAFFGGAEAVAALLARGADPDAVAENDMRVTPLHSAAAAGDGESVRLLLDAGADPNAEQQGGFVPLDSALQRGDEEMAALLRAQGARG
jgi:ankyrin repeat protein